LLLLCGVWKYKFSFRRFLAAQIAITFENQKSNSSQNKTVLVRTESWGSSCLMIIGIVALTGEESKIIFEKTGILRFLYAVDQVKFPFVGQPMAAN